MAWAPAGPSTSSTSNRWPVARPMLACGWRVHQASTRARLMVASLTPWGTRAPRGCLAGWPQPGSRHEQPIPRCILSVVGHRLEVVVVGEGVVQGEHRDGAGGIAEGGVAQLQAEAAHRVSSTVEGRWRCRKLAALLRPQPAASARLRAVQGWPAGRGWA